MDLIYTNKNRVDLGVLSAYAFDLSFGEKENDFEMTLGDSEARLDDGAFVYIEGTEYGGIVDGKKTGTDSETITYVGRTWHGLMNSKVIAPDSGADYLTVSGNANTVLKTLITRLKLGGLFVVSSAASAVRIASYQFERYCKGYDGIRKMLEANGGKLKIAWKDQMVHLSVEPIVDYTKAPVDGDLAVADIECHSNKTNHLICLGKGELKDRTVIHLYVNQNGKISGTQYYTGLDEIADVYDYSSAESEDELRKGGIERLQELRSVDSAEISVLENQSFSYDIGDIVGAVDAAKTRLSVEAAVTQKIVRINNGVVSVEYQTGAVTVAESTENISETE